MRLRLSHGCLRRAEGQGGPQDAGFDPFPTGCARDRLLRVCYGSELRDT